MKRFEKEGLKFGLGRNEGCMTSLYRQIELLSVVERDETGVGLVVTFAVLPSSQKVLVRDFEISDFYGVSSELINGFSCAIFIRDGQIDSLEYSTFDEAWPEDMGTVEFKWISNEQASYDRFFH